MPSVNSFLVACGPFLAFTLCQHFRIIFCLLDCQKASLCRREMRSIFGYFPCHYEELYLSLFFSGSIHKHVPDAPALREHPRPCPLIPGLQDGHETYISICGEYGLLRETSSSVLLLGADFYRAWGSLSGSSPCSR